MCRQRASASGESRLLLGNPEGTFLVIAAPRPSGLPDLEQSRQDFPGGAFFGAEGGRVGMAWPPFPVLEGCLTVRWCMVYAVERSY
jgi:hypothetical protein